MKYDKAPGTAGLSTAMIKSLPEDTMDFLTQVIQEFWTNQDPEFDSWHMTSLSILYKGKENLKI